MHSRAHDLCRMISADAACARGSPQNSVDRPGVAQAEDCSLAYAPPFVSSQIGLAGAWLASSGSVLAVESGPPVGTVAKLEVCVCLL